MSSEISKAIVVLGATGAVGKCVLCELLQSDVFSKITTIGRSKVTDLEGCPGEVSKAEASGRLKQKVINLKDMEKIAEEDGGVGEVDTAVCCLGTTRKDAGSAENFRDIDYGYTVKFAELCKSLGVKSFGLVSASNANKNSWFLYSKTKGETEEALKAMQFSHLSIYQPGLLDRGEKARWVEKMAMGVFFPSIRVQLVGKAVVRDLSSPASDDVSILGNEEMKKIAGSV